MPVPEPTLRTVVVTGIGALIGQGISRSLRGQSGIRIVGVDRRMTELARSFCDVAVEKPDLPETSEAYLEFWHGLLRTHSPAAVLPGLSVDVAFFRNNVEVLPARGSAIMLNRLDLIDLCVDKMVFGAALADAGFPSIPTAQPSSWAEACGVLGAAPLLLKPKRGEGSAGIVTLQNEADFTYWTHKNGDNWMLQRIVGNDNEEFTVGVFGLGDGTGIGPIVFRRMLARAGHTGYAEVVQNDSIREITLEMVRHFRPIGPTNFQFRVDGGVPYLLEINPRFSSSCSLRTAFGFNEAQMSLEYLKTGEVQTPVRLSYGKAWRYNEDFIIHAGDHF